MISNLMLTMFKVYKYLIPFFVFITIASCKKGDEAVKKSKPDIKKYVLKGEPVFTKSYNIERLFAIDSFIITKNLTAGNDSSKLFSVYKIKNASDYVHLHDFGVTGNGPDEFEKFIVQITGQFQNKPDLKMWVYEGNRNKLSRINISQTIKQKSIVIDKIFEIKPGVNFDNVFYINDKKLIGNISNIDTKIDRLRLYNPEKQEVFKRVKVLKIENPRKNDLIFTQYGFNYLYMNSIGFDKATNSIISAMYYLDRIDVFNLDGDVVKTLAETDEDLETTLKSITDKKALIYNMDVSTTSKHTYILSSGRLMNKVFEDENLPVKVKIYDKKMNLKAIIEIKNNINTISVDEIDGYLYGINYIGEQILRFNIKNILDEL